MEGQHCHVEELAAEKARVQQRYDELSAAVDARVDQLEVGQGTQGKVHMYSERQSGILNSVRSNWVIHE